MWCAFKSFGAVKIKQPKELALDRLHYTCNENFLAFLQVANIPANPENVKLQLDGCNAYTIVAIWNTEKSIKYDYKSALSRIGANKPGRGMMKRKLSIEQNENTEKKNRKQIENWLIIRTQPRVF
jgi:hypothetical protein